MIVEAKTNVDFAYFAKFLEFLEQQKELILYQSILHSIKLIQFGARICTYVNEDHAQPISQQELGEWLHKWEGAQWELKEQQPTEIVEGSGDVITYAEYLKIQHDKRQAYVENHPIVKKAMNLFAGARLDDIVGTTY